MDTPFSSVKLMRTGLASEPKCHECGGAIPRETYEVVAGTSLPAPQKYNGRPVLQVTEGAYLVGGHRWYVYLWLGDYGPNGNGKFCSLECGMAYACKRVDTPEDNKPVADKTYHVVTKEILSRRYIVVATDEDDAVTAIEECISEDERQRYADPTTPMTESMLEANWSVESVTLVENTPKPAQAHDEFAERY